MQLLFAPAQPWSPVYDNTLDALVPELWAQESLRILEENMVVATMVHRDFENIVARFGETVHTRRPGEFVAKRKTANDDIVIQDATSTDVEVKLNQLMHVSFILRDGEESKAFLDLADIYIAPAMLAHARHIDQIVLGQYSQFLNSVAGGLGTLTSANVKQTILNTRLKLNQQKAYLDGRNLIWTPTSESVALALDIFTTADATGDGGQALREARLGRRLGFDHFMCQNMSSVAPGNTVRLGAINFAAGYPAGHAAALVVDTFVGRVKVGEWITIAGDDTPYRVSAEADTAGNTTSLTLHKPLRKAVVDNAVITAYNGGLINFAAGYPVGYAKEITVDTFTVAPRVGQAVTFKTNATGPVYTIIGVNGLIGIILDRPLEEALADNDQVNIGPAGEYNFAFHRDAIALVTRPLALPRSGSGALGANVNFNGLSMRATIAYDPHKQGHVITLDMLCGVKVLDLNLGAVLLG